MKLASYKHGRDGKLMIVSRDLTKCIDASDIAPTLQKALDDWDIIAPKLQERAAALEANRLMSEAFDPKKCASPLPRAYQWLDGSTYINHIELARKARGQEMPPNVTTDPLMYQGGSDVFLGPTDDIRFDSNDYGVDFEGEIAVITGDVPMGTKAEDAVKHIRLYMLVNDISLRIIAQEELKKGFGFIQGKPATAFAPVAVTPDEFGSALKDNKIHLPLRAEWNGVQFGDPNAGDGMIFTFPQLITHAAKTRDLCAGTIVGSGTVSNKDRARGHACIVEKRMLEKVETGHSVTPFMKTGDTVKIEMKDADGQSIFGAIAQKVVTG